LGAGLKALFEREPDLTASTETCVAGLHVAARAQCPDAILVVAPLVTVEHAAELGGLAQLSRVILVAKAENTPRSVEALRTGVRAVLAPDASPAEMVGVVRMVVQGDAMILPGSARAGFEREHRRPQSPVFADQAVAALTPREQEVLLHLTRGQSNCAMAQELNVSAATVRSHVHHLLHKLGARTRAQAVALAYESGLIDRLGTVIDTE
jgi:DNA-binding NarL/FixJ family response regulator